MDKWKALQDFWSGFNLPAYDIQSVPDDAMLPYITYEIQTDSLDNVLFLTGSIWYRDTSWAAICRKADEIDRYLSNGGVTIPLEIGYLWINRASPFAQRLADVSDDGVKRVIINIQAEYLSR